MLLNPSDEAISFLAAVVNLVLALTGVSLAVKPPTGDRSKRAWFALFASVGLIGIALTWLQYHRGKSESEEADRRAKVIEQYQKNEALSAQHAGYQRKLENGKMKAIQGAVQIMASQINSEIVPKTAQQISAIENPKGDLDVSIKTSLVRGPSSHSRSVQN